MKLKENPISREIFADDGRCLYRFDGMPLARPAGADGWPIVGEVPTLAAWQADPGRYGPHYATYAIRFGSEREQWTAGGSVVFIRNWIRDTAERLKGTGDWLCWSPRSIWKDRNTARANADVQW